MKKKRIIGIDFGLARIGIATSDPTHMIASPYLVLRAEKKLQETVKNLLLIFKEFERSYECSIGEIIVGMPFMLKGHVGFLADEVRRFIEELKKQTDLPIIEWDERLTSVQAERSLRSADMNRKNRSKVIDKVSAALILQSYLDKKHLTLGKSD